MKLLGTILGLVLLAAYEYLSLAFVALWFALVVPALIFDVCRRASGRSGT